MLHASLTQAELGRALDGLAWQEELHLGWQEVLCRLHGRRVDKGQIRVVPIAVKWMEGLAACTNSAQSPWARGGLPEVAKLHG